MVVLWQEETNQIKNIKMATIKTEYTGNFSTSTAYPMSDNPILTNAKPFGPTDLLTASLSSCIATYIDFIARKHKFETLNVNVEINKTMNVDGTKIRGFDTVVNLNREYSAEQRTIIESAAKNCPVGNSLATDITRTYIFNY
jgi:putative redox protein